MSNLRSKGNSKRPHDAVYRRLFTHPRMIEDLVRKFLAAPWVEKLDFKTLELVASHYVSPYLEQRESDVVWRVRHRRGEHGEGDWFYLYILMELQSRADRFMAVRLWGYMSLFHQSLAKDGKLTPERLLPPIVPVVLYTGEARWSAPTRLEDLIEPVEGISPPSFEYVVLDAAHYPARELEPINDVATGVFRMEQVENPEQLRRVIDGVRGLVEDKESDLDEDFALLVNSILGKLARRGEEVPSVHTLLEAENMLAERAVKWTEQWLEQGRQEGMQQGMQQGMRLGMVEVLRKLAVQRFGELPEWALERLERADVDTLEQWGERLLTAEQLEDVMSDEAA